MWERASDYSLRKRRWCCVDLCLPVLHPKETLVLSRLTARFIGSSVRGCMIPSHLSPDSGVIDSDLCERRQMCQRENMCVSSHQLCSAPLEHNHIWNREKSLTVVLQYPPKPTGLAYIYNFASMSDKKRKTFCMLCPDRPKMQIL